MTVEMETETETEMEMEMVAAGVVVDDDRLPRRGFPVGGTTPPVRRLARHEWLKRPQRRYR